MLTHGPRRNAGARYEIADHLIALIEKPMPLKFITGHEEALTNLFENVQANSVVCYDVSNFPVSSLSAFYPPSYLAKCISVTVAVSGDNTNQRDWMVICPFRIDQTGRQRDKVYDIDPFVVTLDQNSGTPSLTGIVAYHQDFDQRTSPVSGFQHVSREATVAALRLQMVTGAAPIATAPAPVLNALQHMAKMFIAELA